MNRPPVLFLPVRFVCACIAFVASLIPDPPLDTHKRHEGQFVVDTRLKPYDELTEADNREIGQFLCVYQDGE